jgi:hypothetical protein
MTKTGMNASMFLWLSVATAACSSGGGAKPDSGGQACNAIANAGQVVSKTATSDASPDTNVAFMGGAIADGTYVLTAMLNYAMATPPPGTRRETLVFAGNQMNAVFTLNGAAEERYAATYEVPAGFPNNITIRLTCMGAPDVALNTTTAFTATATEFRLGTDTAEISTYTKQ